MNEEIRIPMHEGFCRTAGHGHERMRTEELKATLQRRVWGIGIDEMTFMDRPDLFRKEMEIRLTEAITKDKTKTHNEQKYAFTERPERLRDAITFRMYGKRFTDRARIPVWLPEWIKDLLHTRMEQIMTSSVSTTTMSHYRVCPHTQERGHANFLFGPDVGLCGRRIKKDLLMQAEATKGLILHRKIIGMLNRMRCNGYDPKILSLGRMEMRELRQIWQDPQNGYMDHIVSNFRGKPDFQGLEIEEVDRDTYFAIV